MARVVMLLCLILCTSSFVSPSSPDLLRSGPRRHTLILPKKSDRSPNCNDFASRSECLKVPNCRWCSSDAIDDMCFSSAEAWRLPQQVFTCS